MCSASRQASVPSTSCPRYRTPISISMAEANASCLSLAVSSRLMASFSHVEVMNVYCCRPELAPAHPEVVHDVTEQPQHSAHPLEVFECGCLGYEGVEYVRMQRVACPELIDGSWAVHHVRQFCRGLIPTPFLYALTTSSTRDSSRRSKRRLLSI